MYLGRILLGIAFLTAFLVVTTVAAAEEDLKLIVSDYGSVRIYNIGTGPSYTLNKTCPVPGPALDAAALSVGPGYVLYFSFTGKIYRVYHGDCSTVEICPSIPSLLGASSRVVNDTVYVLGFDTGGVLHLNNCSLSLTCNTPTSSVEKIGKFLYSREVDLENTITKWNSTCGEVDSLYFPRGDCNGMAALNENELLVSCLSFNKIDLFKANTNMSSYIAYGSIDDVSHQAIAIGELVAPVPTEAPTQSPTGAPTESPTSVPSDPPTSAPSDPPSSAPSDPPSSAPTLAPISPTDPVPTSAPTGASTDAPTRAPTASPTMSSTTSTSHGIRSVVWYSMASTIPYAFFALSCCW